MSTFVDRRSSGSSGADNKKKLIERTRDALKKAVKGDFAKRSIKDQNTGRVFDIPADMSEPHFIVEDVLQKRVGVGNKQLREGDLIEKNPRGAGNQASTDGEHEGMSVFLTPEEYMDLLFDGVELPNLTKISEDRESLLWVRAGFSRQGVPSQLNLVKTVKQAKGRKKALTGMFDRELRELEERLERGEVLTEEEVTRMQELSNKRSSLRFIDEVDLRYNNFVEMPKPQVKAVMFCVMDVSGSMYQEKVDMAKRFFFLTFHLLKRVYTKELDVVFVPYSTRAQEVDEETFFGLREGGGTLASCGLEEVLRIWEARFGGEWNGYVSLVSDGDNAPIDNPLVEKAMTALSEKMQFISYAEVGYDDDNVLMELFKGMDLPNFKKVSIPREEDVVNAFLEIYGGKNE